MVVRLALVAVLSTSLVAGTAEADNAKLVLARKAIDGVRYNDAQPLLVAALQEGGNSPATVIEIYRLSASTAIVLGQPEVAEQYYRRWLAMVPNAQLPASVAPKMREPFVTAQAYMAAHGRLVVKARRTTDAIDVSVDSDPLAMVAAVVLDPDVSGGEAAPKPLDANRHARLEIAKDASAGVALLDEFGNHLLEIPAADIATSGVVEPGPNTLPPSLDVSEPAAIPVYRHPLAWAVPAVVLGAVGFGFAFAARGADRDAAAIIANPGIHFFSELSDAQSRRDRFALIANVNLALGGACAVTALVMFATRPKAAPPIAAAPTPGGVVLVMSRVW